MFETSSEIFTRIDPIPARALALSNAAQVGVSPQVIASLRAIPDGQSLSAKQWLAMALAEDRRWDDVEA